MSEDGESELALCGSKTLHLPELSHIALCQMIQLCLQPLPSHSFHRQQSGDRLCSEPPLPFSSQLSPSHLVLLAQLALPSARGSRCVALSHSHSFSKLGS